MSTIKDVAKKCRVSIATVSRAFNNPSSLKQETLDLVQKTAKDLNYRAKNIKTRIGCVMIIVGDLTNPFFTEIIQEISLQLSKYNYLVATFESFDDHAKEKELLEFGQTNNFVCILMITATQSIILTEALKEITIPVVFINRFLKSVDADLVCVDNYLGAYMATKYLIEMGHRKILHLAGPKDYSTTIERRNGFIAAMHDYKIQMSEKDIIHGSIKRERGYNDGKLLSKNKGGYTAIFSMNDIIAASLIISFYEQGVKVPDDISIVGFDDTPMATIGMVKLTTVSRDIKTYSSAAVDLILFRINNREAPSQKIILPPQLIIRDSVKKIG